jgi:curved DNA-binding protein CbpA
VAASTSQLAAREDTWRVASADDPGRWYGPDRAACDASQNRRTVESVADDRDAYKILQVDPSALPEVVDAAYRALARLHHPDVNSGLGESAAMTDLNWAYATLRDPELRIAYDQERTPAPAPTPAAHPTSLRERMQGVPPAEPPSPEPMSALRQRFGAAAGAGAAKAGGPSGAKQAQGSMVLDFGRYAGMTLAQVARTDPQYLEWLKRHSSGFRYRRQIDELLAAAATKRASG